MSVKHHSFGFVLLLIFLVIITLKLLSGSLFVYAPERIQFVVYGQNTRLYSISKQDDVNYYVAYAPDVKVVIPNGYGTYRIGSLSKLTRYERKPELISKAFSAATSSFVTYYFYPANGDVYYGEDASKDYRKPTVQELFFSKSNARLLDRVYLFWRMTVAPTVSFQPLDIELLTSKQNNDRILSPDVFGDEYRGYLYNRTYRSERLRVQIKYSNNYDTAVMIGKILEGNGIRVVDIAQANNDLKRCSIIVKNSLQAQTVHDVSTFFGCNVRQGSVERSDIILELGTLEKSWEL